MDASTIDLRTIDQAAGNVRRRDVGPAGAGRAVAPPAEGLDVHRLRPALALRGRRLELARLEAYASGWLDRHSVGLLRLSLGLVFLGFGVLKFVPGLSPAEGLAEQTTRVLTLGLVPGNLERVIVAVLETAIGLSLVTGRLLRVGLALLGVAMVGVLSPVVLFPGELFAGPAHAPTLEGQYVLKDVVLLAAWLVVAASALGQQLAAREPDRARGTGRN